VYDSRAFCFKSLYSRERLVDCEWLMKYLVMPAMNGFHGQGAALNVFVISSFRKQVELEIKVMK
jgi:hypothetical protein